MSIWYNGDMTPVKSFALRLPSDLFARIKADAAADERSVNWKIVDILRRYYGLTATVSPSLESASVPTTKG